MGIRESPPGQLSSLHLMGLWVIESSVARLGNLTLKWLIGEGEKGEGREKERKRGGEDTIPHKVNPRLES